MLQKTTSHVIFINSGVNVLKAACSSSFKRNVFLFDKKKKKVSARVIASLYEQVCYSLQYLGWIFS